MPPKKSIHDEFCLGESEVGQASCSDCRQIRRVREGIAQQLTDHRTTYAWGNDLYGMSWGKGVTDSIAIVLGNKPSEED